MKMFYVTKEFIFDAAHNLLSYHGKCEKLHGHTYKVQITVVGEPAEEGMVIDFLELKAIARSKAIDLLDHSYINEIISQPTAENIARWIFERVSPELERENCRVYEVTVWETPTSSAKYRVGEI
jgi:6-pyruvoyltetrahydropterin/6-carboxytetrahydropterin synthase